MIFLYRKYKFYVSLDGKRKKKFMVETNGKQ